MKVLVSDFDGTLFENNQIKCLDKINKFVNEGNVFIIATGRNISSLQKDLNKFNLNCNYFICNDGAIILDQYLNLIYRLDIDNVVVRPLYNELKDDENILEVLIDTGNGYIDDINRPANKMIARYFDKEKALTLVNKINSKYPSVFSYVSNNWINITKKTETKGKAIEFLANYYNLNKYPIYVVENDINDVSMCDYDYISYGIKCFDNKYTDRFNHSVNDFEEAFDNIVNE